MHSISRYRPKQGKQESFSTLNRNKWKKDQTFYYTITMKGLGGIWSITAIIKEKWWSVFKIIISERNIQGNIPVLKCAEGICSIRNKMAEKCWDNHLNIWFVKKLWKVPPSISSHFCTSLRPPLPLLVQQKMSPKQIKVYILWVALRILQFETEKKPLNLFLLKSFS